MIFKNDDVLKNDESLFYKYAFCLNITYKSKKDLIIN